MSSRREFLEGSSNRSRDSRRTEQLGLAALLGKSADKGKSKVVIARDPALHGADGKLDEKRVGELLDRAIASYTGRTKPADAWKHIVAEGGGQDRVIGIKTNGLGGKGISTHAVLVLQSQSGCSRQA